MSPSLGSSRPKRQGPTWRRLDCLGTEPCQNRHKWTWWFGCSNSTMILSMSPGLTVTVTVTVMLHWRIRPSTRTEAKAAIRPPRADIDSESGSDWAWYVNRSHWQARAGHRDPHNISRCTKWCKEISWHILTYLNIFDHISNHSSYRIIILKQIQICDNTLRYLTCFWYFSMTSEISIYLTYPIRYLCRYFTISLYISRKLKTKRIWWDIVTRNLIWKFTRNLGQCWQIIGMYKYLPRYVLMTWEMSKYILHNSICYKISQDL